MLSGALARNELVFQWDIYRIHLNRHGNLMRNWPGAEAWSEYELLKARALACGERPNIIDVWVPIVRGLEARWLREGDSSPCIVRDRLSDDEVAEIIRQYRRFEELVFVYSGGRAKLHSEITIINDALRPTVRGNWFFPGPFKEFAQRYRPFARGEFDSVIGFFPPGSLPLGMWGGTYGADWGLWGAGNSNNAWLRGYPQRHGFVIWHEWLNQWNWCTRNVMGYPRDLWNLYIFSRTGYEPDPLPDWPWITSHRDVMRHYISPRMWRRSTMIDPHRSQPIRTWWLLGPFRGDEALAALPPDAGLRWRPFRAPEGEYVDLRQATDAQPGEVVFLQALVESAKKQEVRLWTGSDGELAVFANGKLIKRWPGLRAPAGGHLQERCNYVELEKGINRIVLQARRPKGERWEVFARLAASDGSGEMPQGVRVLRSLAELVPERLVPTKRTEPINWRNPKHYDWSAVRDDPWTMMPRVDDEALRQLTGIADLELVAMGAYVLVDVKGSKRVLSPVLENGDPNDFRLNNELNTRAESMAVVRFAQGADGSDGRDLVLVRIDAADVALNLLKHPRNSKRPEPAKALIGWGIVDWKVFLVLDTYLGELPNHELAALEERAAQCALWAQADRYEAAPGDVVRIDARVETWGPEESTAVFCAGIGEGPDVVRAGAGLAAQFELEVPQGARGAVPIYVTAYVQPQGEKLTKMLPLWVEQASAARENRRVKAAQ